MKSNWLQRFALAGALLTVGIVGCAEERAPINQVQADALDKHFFVGKSISDDADNPEFYWRNYVIGGTTSQSLVGTGSWSGIDRVKWEVTENTLIARKAYQIAKGADPYGVPEKVNGVVVAAYRITSHFDIKRAYNPQTGEELNVVTENMSDRPWYQREYMRVDWSTNLVESPMWFDMFYGNIFGHIGVTPVSYYVNDPKSDEAPHFEVKDGYFDITNKFYVSPDTTQMWGIEIPTCVLVGLFTGSATFNCDAQEATIRSSYWKVNPNDDFEPLENTVAPLDVVGNPGGIGDSFQVGIVTAGQQGWDPAYGYVDKLYHRFAHIHNNWVASHQQGTSCNSNRDSDNDGSADQCANSKTGYAGAKGSQCDVFVGKCTLPYRDRQVKPIGYWVNQEMPADLMDPVDEQGNKTNGDARGPSEDLLYSWNQLMSGALAYAREVECRRTGDGERAACHDQFFNKDQVMLSYGAWLVDDPKEETPALVLCHNPVRPYDRQETCGETGAIARTGDVRKNFLFYWPYDSRAPWGGIANWNADPVTGQIFGAAAQIMGRSATYAAGLQRDILQVAQGDRTIEEITNGTPAANYAHYMKNGYSPMTLDNAEIQARVNQVDSDHLARTVPVERLAGTTVAQKYRSFVTMQKSMTPDPLVQSTALADFGARVKPLLGTPIETALLDSHWMVGALGWSPATPLNDTVLSVASPLRALDRGTVHAWQNMVQDKLRAHGVCYMDNEAPMIGSYSLPGLAKYFMDKYPNMSAQERGEKIYHDLWIEAYKGIAIHEIGHSLGMLHQFASSWDSVNFLPQYWQLRTDEKAVNQTVACSGAQSNGTTCMGPRYLDPETLDEQGLDAESRPGLDYFGSSSVMEYQIERFGETVGLGTYDRHTMNALYGRVLETMDESVYSPADQLAFAPRLETQLTEQDRIQRSIPALGGVSAWPTHYTEVARQMKVFDPNRDCRAATDAERALGEWRIVHGKVCASTPRDHAAWGDFVSTANPVDNQTAPYWQVRGDAKTSPSAVRWWYRFGTSHNAYFHTNDSDAGADPYEVTRNTVRVFDLTYPFQYFRRQNREYNYYQGIASRVADRFFDRMRSYHWLVANSSAFYKDFGDTVWSAIANDDNWHKPYLVAEADMFGLLTRAVLMPQPGAYNAMGIDPGQNEAYYDTGSNSQFAPAFTIQAVDGRFIDENFNSDPDAGGSWDYLHWMNHAGFSTEKAYAVSALTDGRPNLSTISRENYLDGRGVKINFRNDLPDAVDRLVGGILSEDWETTGMAIVPGGASSTPQLLDFMKPTPTRAAGSMVTFPNIGYRQQLFATVFASIYSRENSDMTLVNKMRIWLQGSVEEITVPDADQIRFTDPVNGYTYVARKYGDQVVAGKTVDKGIASRMLVRANALLAAAYKVQTDGSGKAVLDAFGQPTLTLDADGQPQYADPAGTMAGKLTMYVGLLDTTRQIGHLLGYGPLTAGSGD
ncbi:MAG: hypothetical protein OZ921_10725 [Sorangiineae bacterium]|nr:hypothetical protein [Polyangiaceae bacterium]MEB2322982.1 hypothetical protein [Sorangiineae bacterium]